MFSRAAFGVLRSGKRQALVRCVSTKPPAAPGLHIPFADDLSNSKDELLENFPNLEGFLGPSMERPETEEKRLEERTQHESTSIPPPELDSVDWSDQIIKNFTAADLDELNELTDLNNLVQIPRKQHINLGKFASFKEQLHGNDTAPKRRPLDLARWSTRASPFVVISKFNDPHLNLALEYYIFDQMPATTSRLVLYKNKPCIVFGKNQNPLKEINFHYANITSTPLLRRLSGGGTVVHDMGNWNFSYMSKKSKFHRTQFTDMVLRDLNALVENEEVELAGAQIQLPTTLLHTIAKGDIVDTATERKISGSAYKLAKGKFIHHGTMLLESQLDHLRKLLKLTDARKESIVANGTDSISSPVANYKIDQDLFLYLMAESFKTEYVQDTGQEAVLIVDDYAQLPREVLDRREQLTHWSWVFGKTPQFEHTLVHHELGVSVKFTVANFNVKDVEINGKEDTVKSLFGVLQDTVANGEPVRYGGDSIASFIADGELADWIRWEIDFGADYKNFDVDINK